MPSRMVAQRGNSDMSSNSEASPSRQITVVDVYDLASAIGKDFELLIESFGTDCVRELMPKVRHLLTHTPFDTRMKFIYLRLFPPLKHWKHWPAEMTERMKKYWV